jgi:hypothetical protein
VGRSAVNAKVARRLAGLVLAVGGVVAMLVAFFAFANLAALYCSAAVAVVGGILSVGALGGVLLVAGTVGGFCVLLASLGDEGDPVPAGIQVFGWLVVVFLVLGLVVLAFSVWRSTRRHGWPWVQ